MKKTLILICFFFLSPATYGKNEVHTPGTLPVIMYAYKPNPEATVSYAASCSENNPPEVQEINNASVAKAIQSAKSAICGAAENIDAKVWMSFDIHGEVGIVAKAGASMQSGFEVTFHCGKLKKHS